MVWGFVVCIINHRMRPGQISERNPVHIMLPWHVYYQHKQHYLLQMPCKHWELFCIKRLCELYYYPSSKPTVAMPNGER